MQKKYPLPCHSELPHHIRESACQNTAAASLPECSEFVISWLEAVNCK